MTDNEILQKAIEKAQKNGWDRPDIEEIWEYYDKATSETPGHYSFNFMVKDLIFSHSFAKAFFPKEDEHGFHKDDAWKFYLQEMVIEEKPLQYLRKFL